MSDKRTPEELATLKALDALDAMAEQWASSFNLRHMVESMCAEPDRIDRLETFMKLAWTEGAFTGRRSLVQFPPKRQRQDAPRHD